MFMKGFYSIFSDGFCLFKSLEQLIRYSISGFIGFLINVSIYFALYELLHVYYVLASFLAFALPQTVSFLIDKYWSFRNRSKKKIEVQFTKFFIVSAAALSVNLSLLYLLVQYSKLHHLISQLISLIVASTISFLGHRNWTFRKETR